MYIHLSVTSYVAMMSDYRSDFNSYGRTLMCLLTRPQHSVASEMGQDYACNHSTALNVVWLCWNLLYFEVFVYAWAIFAVVICSYSRPTVQSEVCNRSGWHEMIWLQMKSAVFFFFLTHLAVILLIQSDFSMSSCCIKILSPM